MTEEVVQDGLAQACSLSVEGCYLIIIAIWLSSRGWREKECFSSDASGNEGSAKEDELRVVKRRNILDAIKMRDEKFRDPGSKTPKYHDTVDARREEADEALKLQVGDQ